MHILGSSFTRKTVNSLILNVHPSLENTVDLLRTQQALSLYLEKSL